MIRMNIKGQDLGLKVEQVELQVESIEEAQDWIKEQFNNWGVDAQKIEETVSFEKLDLLLDNNA